MSEAKDDLGVKRFLKPKITAGRNLRAAVAVGVLLALLVVVAVFLGPLGWYPLVAAAAGIGTWEVCTRLREGGYVIPRTLTIITGQVMIWLTWPLGTEGLVAAYVTAVLALMVGRLFHHGRNTPPRNYLRDTAVGVFVLTWIPMFGSFAAMLSLLEDHGAPSGFYIITFMLCVVGSDIGGYVAGVLFGRHPMAPAVSPKKSWEGFVGSIVLAMIAGGVSVGLLLDYHWWVGILLGLLLAVCATLGDLVESQFKRDLSVKDMSGLLPGHGGMMDRIDGILPASMVTWVILSIVSG